MPFVFYIKYFDLTLDEGAHFRTEFFFSEKEAKIRGDEILKKIHDAGGKDNCDMDYGGGIGWFQYRCYITLIWELNKLNDIHLT